MKKLYIFTIVASLLFLGSSFKSPKSSGYFSQMEIIQNSSIDNISEIDYKYQGRGCRIGVPSGDTMTYAAGTLCFKLSGDCKKSKGCTAVGSVSAQINAQNSATGVTIEDCQRWADAHAQDLITQDYYDAEDYQIIYDLSFHTLVRLYKQYHPRRH